MFTAASTHRRAIPWLISLALFAPGCKNEDNDPSEGSTGAMFECPACEAGQDVYLCVIDGNEKLMCFDDLTTAQTTCGAVPGDSVVGSGSIPCDTQSGDSGPPPQSDGQIVFDPRAQVYEVDHDFFQTLLRSPNRLRHDHARLEWRGDHFEFESIAPGDVVGTLGFINGDQLLEINGYPLSTMEQISDAYEALQKSTTFTVAVGRRDATVVLNHER